MTDELGRPPEFGEAYWNAHWQPLSDNESATAVPANPYMARELADLRPGTALDAGCGEGAEAIWLAGRGWDVTAADISAAALTRARQRVAGTGMTGDRMHWLQADLSTWEPVGRFDLVTTHYAHPAMPQLAFYQRISRWVAPGGTLLIVGHLQNADGGHGHHTAGHGHDSADRHPDDHDVDDHAHGQQPAERATVTAGSVISILDQQDWDIVTADELRRTVAGGSSGPAELRDVVVRATRRAEQSRP